MVTIEINHRVNDKALVLDDSTYLNSFGQVYTISKFNYYIGKLKLHEESGKIIEFKDYHFISEEKSSSKSFNLKNVHPGKYKSIEFILGVDSIDNCKIFKGDFTDGLVQENLINFLNNEKFDIILSDIAENSTGNKSLDSMRSNIMTVKVINFSLNCLKKGGAILIKTFSGSGQKEVVDLVKKSFAKYFFIKPESSRKESKELYLYCIL